jgi:hypothetical protein
MEWVADVVACSAEAHDRDGGYYVTIDGYPEPELIRRIFAQRRLDLQKVRGGRDESDALLRLADCTAGFVADHLRGKAYAEPHWRRLARHFRAV